MIELAVFLGGMFLLGVLLIVGGLLIAKLVVRGGKAAASGAEGIIHAVGDELHGLADGVGPTFHRTLTHGQKVGRAIDAIDSLGALMKQDGYMTDAQWQPHADALNTAVAQTKYVAPAATTEAA